jgi:hypothetical protein
VCAFVSDAEAYPESALCRLYLYVDFTMQIKTYSGGLLVYEQLGLNMTIVMLTCTWVDVRVPQDHFRHAAKHRHQRPADTKINHIPNLWLEITAH